MFNGVNPHIFCPYARSWSPAESPDTQLKDGAREWYGRPSSPSQTLGFWECHPDIDRPLFI